MNRNGPFLILGILLVAVIVVVIVLGIQTSNKITANNNSIADLQTQNTTLKNSLTNSNSQIATLSDQLTQTKTQLAQANTQLTALNTQVTTDSSQINSLKTQLATANTDVATLKTKVTSLESEVATLTTKAASLQTQIDDLDSSSSGSYTTLVSNKDFLNIAANDGYVILKTFEADDNNDGYLYITGDIVSSSYEDDVYVVVVKEDDTHNTISEVISHENGLSDPWGNYVSLAAYDDDEDISAGDNTVKIYLVNTSSVIVDAESVTVRYYLD